jgi:hypothetical protein
VTSKVDHEISAAMMEIGEGVGPNIAVVVPPEQRNVDPISLVVAFGGILLASYMRGLKAQADTDAEEAGRSTVRWLSDKVAHLFDKTPAETEQEATEEVSQALEEFTPGPPEEISTEKATAARKPIEEYLRSNGMSPREAARVAEIVSERGALLIAIPSTVGSGEST